MKIIQITDTHLLGNNKTLFGIDPKLILKKALVSIEKNHSDAEFVVITGDLTNNGKIEAYSELESLLKDFSIPVHLIMGNHDIKKIYNQVFNRCEDDEFVQYAVEFDNNTFLFLDTSVSNEQFGVLCHKRLTWLGNKLLKNKSKNVYIFMHHFPFNSEMPWMENNANFRNKKEFWDVVLKYQNVKQIFTGHLHRIINANYKGVGVSCTRSTNFQVAFTPNTEEDLLTNKENPTYAVTYIDEDSVLIHNHEFLDEDKCYLADYQE